MTNYSRFGATVEQVKHDVMDGIGNSAETGGMVQDGINAIRNTFVATYHAFQGIIPSVVNAGSDQRFQVVHREERALSGTANSVSNITTTASEGNVLATASAVLSEFTDGPADDLAHTFGGGANYHIQAV